MNLNITYSSIELHRRMSRKSSRNRARQVRREGLSGLEGEKKLLVIISCLT